MDMEPWIKEAREAAFEASAADGKRGQAIGAVASNLLVGLQGWPGSQSERDRLADYFRSEPREGAEAVQTLRERVRKLMLGALRDDYLSCQRKRYALLALANLYVMGVGDPETLKRFDRARWVTPGLREYVRDALLGVDGMGRLIPRNCDLEMEICKTPAPDLPDPPADNAGDGRSPGGERDTVAEDARTTFARTLKACGVRAFTEPEPDAVRAALRAVLRRLLLEGWEGLPNEVRDWTRYVGVSEDRPTFARYCLARALTERPELPLDVEWVDGEGRRVRSRAWKPDDDQRAFMGDPAHPPRLPPALAGGAITLLALVEVEEAHASPEAWRGRHNAFNVVAVVADEPRWPAGIRAAMAQVVAQNVEDTARLARHVERLALPEAQQTAAGQGPADGLPGTVLTGPYFDGLESKAAVAAAGLGPALTPAEESILSASVYRRGAATHLEAARHGAFPTTPRGEQGPRPAEQAASESGSPGSREGQESQRPEKGERPEPESLAIAHLTRAIREKQPIPSQAECARVAGCTRQAAQRWPTFQAMWKHAKATEKGGTMRRGGRDRRTGNVEAEDDAESG